MKTNSAIIYHSNEAEYAPVPSEFWDEVIKPESTLEDIKFWFRGKKTAPRVMYDVVNKWLRDKPHICDCEIIMCGQCTCAYWILQGLD